jgi:hypothetical protein
MLTQVVNLAGDDFGCQSVHSRGVTLLHRLETALALSGVSQRELARRSKLGDERHLGVLLGRLRKNPDSGVELATLRAIAHGAQVSEAWLITGHGSPELDGIQQHPPDEVDPSARLSNAHEAAAAARPIFADLPEWPQLVAGAKARAAERNRAIPEWAWEAIAATSTALTDTPTSAAIYELVCLYADHGWGRPREVKETARHQTRTASAPPSTVATDPPAAPTSENYYALDESGPSGVRPINPAAAQLPPLPARKQG